MGFGIEKYKPVGTAEYTLPLPLGFDDLPVLELRYAGKGNSAFMSALLKNVNDPETKKLGTGKVTERKMDAARARDAELFARTVVVGWKNVGEIEAPGVAVPFSTAKAEELLLELAEHRPDDFDDLRRYARDADNFPNAVAQDAGTELGKK